MFSTHKRTSCMTPLWLQIIYSCSLQNLLGCAIPPLCVCLSLQRFDGAAPANLSHPDDPLPPFLLFLSFLSFPFSLFFNPSPNPTTLHDPSLPFLFLHLLPAPRPLFFFLSSLSLPLPSLSPPIYSSFEIMNTLYPLTQFFYPGYDA